MVTGGWRRAQRLWVFLWLTGWAASADPSQAGKLFVSLSEQLGQAKDFVGALAAAVVTAPNAKVPMGPKDDHLPEELRKQRVDKQLRVELGTPPFSMSVWLIGPSVEKSKGTLFLLPGVCSYKECLAGRARSYAKAGFRSVLVDFRGQGRSGGKFMTYGAREAQDLRALLDELLKRGEIRRPVGAYGMSYGGACAIQFAGIDSRVQAVVARSAFSSIREVVPSYARLYLPFMRGFLTEAVLKQVVDRAGELAGFDPDQANTLTAIQKTKAPVLLIHGERDINIPIAQAERLHQGALDHSRLIRVPDGTHDGAALRRVENAEILKWFQGHLLADHPSR